MKLKLFFILILISYNIQAVFHTISTSGQYVYGEDVNFNPTTVNDSVILITTSSVLLDLNNHIITQGNLIAGATAITVADNLTNITIKNGTLASFTGTGIIVQSGCSEITIENILTVSCDARAIAFVGTTTNKTINSSIQDVIAFNCCRGPISDAAIFLGNSNNITLINARIENCGISSHNFSAVKLNICDSCRFDTIFTTSNIGQTLTRQFDLTTLTNSFFSNCMADNNMVVVTNGSCNDWEFVNSNTNNFFVNCYSTANTATVAGGTSIGFLLNAGNDNNTLSNCRVSSNNANSTCAGFSLTTANTNYLMDCMSIKNNSVAGNCTGYIMNNCTGCYILRSIAANNSAGAGTCVGIDLTTGTGSECYFQNNVITRNDGSAAATSFGFRITGANNVHGFIKNISMRNGATAGNQFNGFAGGQVNNVALNNTNGITDFLSNIGLV